jgi:hypothetical protein
MESSDYIKYEQKKGESAKIDHGNREKEKKRHTYPRKTWWSPRLLSPVV